MEDSHLHITALPVDLKEAGGVLRKIHSAGVDRLLVNSVFPAQWPLLMRLADMSQNHRDMSVIYPQFGVHPWYVHHESVQGISSLEDNLSMTLDRASSLGLTGVGVGEIGLDRVRSPEIWEDQLKLFRVQLHLASCRNLITSIHCVRCWGILLHELGNVPSSKRILHSYAGSKEMIPLFSELGCFFSYSPRAVVRDGGRIHATPADLRLVETDAEEFYDPEILFFMARHVFSESE